MQQIDDLYQPVQLVTPEKFDNIEQALTETFLRNDIDVSDKDVFAHSRLVISDEKEPERETITSGTDGDEQIFIMQWRFSFLIRKYDTEKTWHYLLDDQIISVSKIVNKNQLEQHTGGASYDSVRGALRLELADRIVLQLNSVQPELSQF